MHLFYFVRSVRTQTSERYLIWLERGAPGERSRVGSLELHFVDRTIYGTLVLEAGLLYEDRFALLEQIDYQLIADDREDFIFNVYQAREVGMFSDNISENEQVDRAVSRADIEDIRSSLSQVIGRHQSARGKLAEHAVVGYFESQGYKAQRAGSELDALKVDVVAESDEEIIYAQSKLGGISATEIRKVVSSIAKLPASGGKATSAAIIARVFPPDVEFSRRALEKEFGISVLCIQLYQVTTASPEYKGVLGA